MRTASRPGDSVSAAAGVTGAETSRRGNPAAGATAPYGVAPTAAGLSARTSSTSGTSSAVATVTTSAAARHPGPAASATITGRNTSCPVALAAEKIPVTSPRCRSNQRLATIAPNTSAIDPVPAPMATPQSSHSCHADVISVVSPLAIPTTARAMATTRRMPNRSISAAAKGAVRP